ncbi:MAG: MBOAT family O-acyltransferase [Candidatus Paceibacterota bacterium]|jgi:D-alanyl-lipoteichoic acid acyltransferase DltB (MBOAT superfamily)
MAFIPAYILILFVTIGIDYWAGIKIEESEGKTQKRWLILSVISTVLVLAIFKYFNFFNSNLAVAANFFHWNYPIHFINIILPIGLSFHTFQSLSYVIEVYFGRFKAERHLGIYSLYVMFYPQLVAGPIERPQNLLHQFREEHFFEYVRVVEGMRRMLWGLFKKMVIADNLVSYVNKIYRTPTEYDGIVLLIATILFSIQIYCDFSGYADIAIGSAKVMGFKLMENFKNPYFASSIPDFWARWHISLSTWFRDYVYIPLGGNRIGKARYVRNILATFLLSGLWHGANWTYVAWGGIHGLFTVFSRFFSRASRVSDSAVLLFLNRFVTLFIVCIAWVFFRAKTVGEAWYIVAHILKSFCGLFVAVFSSVYSMSITPVFLFLKPIAIWGRFQLAFLLGIVIIFVITEIIDYKKGVVSAIGGMPEIARWLVYVCLIFGILNFSITQEVPFIYFQF